MSYDNRAFANAVHPYFVSSPVCSVLDVGLAGLAASVESATRRFPVEAFVSPCGSLHLRDATVRYAEELPMEWMVGAYLTSALRCDIEADIGMRLREIGWRPPVE